jgi:chitin disaccharide deacetylase
VNERILIVNADDFGIDRKRNLGIVESARSGVVTSTSLLPTHGLEKEDCSCLLRVFGGRIGIHLNLTEGTPLSTGLRTLVDSSGQFLGKQKAWTKALMRWFDPDEVEQELTSQIKQLQSWGIIPDHIDSHNHIHIFPGISEVVARLARRFDLWKIRLPRESFFCWRQYFERGTLKKGLMDSLASRAAVLFRKSGIVAPDYFAGVQFPTLTDISSVQAFIRTLPPGTTELMCHPGNSGSCANPFSNGDREREFLSLTHPSVLEEIKRSKIRISSFKELQR